MKITDRIVEWASDHPFLWALIGVLLLLFWIWRLS